MGYNNMKSDRSAMNGTGIKSAEPIVKHIYSGETSTPGNTNMPPESFMKGVSNTGGKAPMGRVFNEVK